MPKPEKTPSSKQAQVPHKASPPLSPAQQQALKSNVERKEAKNRLKLKEKSQGQIVPKEENAGLLQLQVMEATGAIDIDAGAILLSQVISAQATSNNIDHANAAVAMLQGIGPQDELEGMLAGQMVAVHNMSMEYARRAMGKDLNLDQANSLINRTTKLMHVFTRQVEALQKYRTKGQQKITVQHVQVSQGGQAIIGDVHQAGGGVG